MQIEKRLADATRGPAKASGFLVATFAIALSACEGGVVVRPSGVSASPAASATLSAAMSPENAPFAGPAFVEPGCAGRPYFTPALDIVIAASTTVNLDRVTLRLLDGSHLGGPVITFPRPGLTNEFGTTVIVAGDRRSFRFHPRFPCAETPRAVAVDLGLVDLSGATHDLTVSRSLR